MRDLVYALRFTGRATPVGSAGGVLAASMTAPGSTLTATIGPDGLSGSFRPAAGAEATFESEVTFTGDTGFLEVGTIGFGDGNVLRFATVGQGYLGASADPARRQGAVVRRVEGGEGQFAGASGLIASTFFVTDDLAVTDHHLGVIVLP